MRISDKALAELINNDGWVIADRRQVNPTGVLRLALDLLDAREALAVLKDEVRAARGEVAAIMHQGRIAGR
jgi:hypothetical protein